MDNYEDLVEAADKAARSYRTALARGFDIGDAEGQFAMKAIAVWADIVKELREARIDLLGASSIGIATILAQVGAYETLTPYMRAQYEKLQSFHKKCDREFIENQHAAIDSAKGKK